LPTTTYKDHQKQPLSNSPTKKQDHQPRSNHLHFLKTLSTPHPPAPIWQLRGSAATSSIQVIRKVPKKSRGFSFDNSHSIQFANLKKARGLRVRKEQNLPQMVI